MKVITLWPEWAWAVCKLGKDVENRTRQPPSTLKPGDLLAIHAGTYLGGTQRHQSIGAIFEPVSVMARRAGWRLGTKAADNTIIGFSILTPTTFEKKVHEIPKGAVVTVTRYAGVLEPCKSPQGAWVPWWAGDQYGWKLEEVRTLVSPVSCRGQQGLWNLPPEIEEAVRGQDGR